MLKQLDTLIGFAVVMLVVSLLITIVTQMVSSLLALRGKNLADALQVMMNKIAPGIGAAQALGLAHEILTQPVISDSMMSMSEKIWDKVPGLARLRKGWKIGSAIRPDELYEVLKDIRDNGLAPLQTSATALLTALGAAPSANTTAAITAVTTPAALATLAGKDITEAKLLIQQVAHATDVTAINLEKWVNSAQDRAQQWFAIHTRLITVVAAFVAAFVLQLDTIDLLKRISLDSDMRAKLVAGSDKLLKETGKVLADKMSEVVDKATHNAAITNLKKSYPTLPAGLDNQSDFPSIEKAKLWLSAQLEKDDKLKDDAKQRDAIVGTYERTITSAKVDASMATMQRVAGATGLQLLPEPYPWNHWSWPLRHLLGIVISVALLSLGAPFWYNTLKTLTSLRPLLADEVDKNPKQTTPTAGGKK